VDFKAARGDFIVINGPSGSGKTTFLNMISLIDEPTEGEVYVEGQLVSGLSQSKLAEIRRDKIGLMFQTFNLIPVLSAFENIEYPLLLKGIDKNQRREKVMSLLEAVDLAKEANRRPDQLSGGQKQRVALARTLVNDPTIVLADEPTGNLDTKTSGRVMEMIARLNKDQGVTFLVVTHDMMVNDYANRLVHIRDGQLTELEDINDISLNGSMNGAAKEGVANVVANRVA
jgi:putative ABC transport system ATP-binding protein